MVESEETKIKRACETRGLSVKQMCERTDSVVYKTLLQQFARGSRIPHVWIDEIAHVLEYPLSYFSKYLPTMGASVERDADDMARAAANLIDVAMNTAHMAALRRQSQIGTIDVLDWLDRNNGELVDFDALKDSVDLFEVMGAVDNIPTPYRIGRDSLSTQQFEIDNEEHYVRKLKTFHPSVLENIKKGRIEASYRPYMLATVEFRAEVGGKWIVEKYRRLTAKVYLPNKQELTLVHAVLVPNTRREDHAATDLDLIQPPSNREAVPQE